MKAILIWLLVPAVFQLCENYKILGLFPIPSQSHMVMFESLMKGLAERGHEVDVLSHFPLKEPVPRYNDLSVRGSLPVFVNNFTVDYARKTFGTYYGFLKYLLFAGTGEICDTVLNTKAAKELKNSDKKYDLVISEVCMTDCMLGFAHHFKVPIIGITSGVDKPWGAGRIGNPNNPAYIPLYMVPYSSRMSLVERLINTSLWLLCILGFEISHKYNTAIVNAHFGPDSPDIETLIHNTSLIFANSHFSINNARPAVPNFIEVGGLHIPEPKALPKHFEDSLNTTGTQYKGVIYLSTGSMVMTETFPSYKLQALFEAFKELPYKVLWKAVKKNMPKDVEIPSNIQFEPWMPQLDIICHPNVKLFVSHGGLMGTQESVYCKVPRLGIPLFADQLLNLRVAEDQGLAIVVDYDDITKENILNAAKALLENPKYKINVDRAAKIFKDRPMSPMDTAIYWTEYVIRHQGAPHLRTVGADLPWYQYYLLDVGAILITLTITLLMIVYYLTKQIFKICFSSHKVRPKVD